MSPEPPHHSHVVRHLRRHTEARKLADHWAQQVALGEEERGQEPSATTTPVTPTAGPAGNGAEGAVTSSNTAT